MGIYKDWRQDNEGSTLLYKIKSFFNIKDWLMLHKYRKQRADRGWSDRDIWGAGEHIAQMTAEMLQYLNDKYYCNWPDWFKLNILKPGGYKNLQQVIDDINNYLEYQKTSWTDDLDLDDNQSWAYTGTRKKLTEKQISTRIKNYHKKELILYKKANKAMGFFGRHFASFWD